MAPTNLPHLSDYRRLRRELKTEADCKQFLADMRWPNGVACPRCGKKERIYALKARPFHWVCRHKGCGGRNGYRFSVITRTIFEDGNFSPELWFRSRI